MSRYIDTGASLFDRLVSTITIHDHGCWEWNGCMQSKGYGSIGISAGRTAQAHRVSYELFVGPIPDGLTLDHLCKNKRCVNPIHLEPVTARENTLRGDGYSGLNARKTHCKRGHLLGEPKLRSRTGVIGFQRRCQECARSKRPLEVAA